MNVSRSCSGTGPHRAGGAKLIGRIRCAKFNIMYANACQRGCQTWHSQWSVHISKCAPHEISHDAILCPVNGIAQYDAPFSCPTSNALFATTTLSSSRSLTIFSMLHPVKRSKAPLRTIAVLIDMFRNSNACACGFPHVLPCTPIAQL